MTTSRNSLRRTLGVTGVLRRTTVVALSAAVLVSTTTTSALGQPAIRPSVTGGGVLRTFAGGLGSGPATDVAQYPYEIAVSGGRLLIADNPFDAHGPGPMDGPSAPGIVRAVDLASGNETVVAGNGRAVSADDGDGGPALRASFQAAVAVAGDGTGAIFVSDQDARVRRVGPDGTVVTVAGNGTSGFSGDGGPATAASLHEPRGLAVGPDGSLYIADSQNHRVRRVDGAGIITTVAGRSTADGSGDGGPALSAALFNPWTLAVDPAGNLYIGGNGIRKVTPAGTITTVGTFGASFVATDPAGNLFAGGGGEVYRVDPSGAPTLVAGISASGGGNTGDGGPATAATVGPISGLALDGQGSMYIADGRHQRVRRVDPTGTISTFAGNGSSTLSGDGRAATQGRLATAGALATGPSGVFVSDDANDRLRRVEATGTITSAGGPTRGMVQDGSGNLYYSGGPGDHRVYRRAASGEATVIAGTGVVGSTGDGGPAVAAQLDTPSGLALDGNGNLYIADYGSGRVRRVSPSGVISNYIGADVTDSYAETRSSFALGHTRIPGVTNLSVGPDGAVYFANGTRTYRARCGVVSPFGPAGALAVDAAGAVYIANNGSVDRYGTDASVTTVVGGGTVAVDDGIAARAARFDVIDALALDDRGGLYVSTDDRVMRVDGVAAPASAPGAPCESFDHPVWAWGWNGLGQVGDGTMTTHTTIAADHPPLSGATSVAAGLYHSLAVKADGTVWAWGWNGFGQLGDATITNRTSPVRVGGLPAIKAVGAGAFHSLALATDGSVWAWGYNAYGELGNGSTASSATPMRVLGLSGVTAIAGGGVHSLAVTGDGKAWAWGWNALGQLGDGTTVDRRVPVRVAGSVAVTGVAAGTYHSLAVLRDGRVAGWGWNGYGQVGDGSTTGRLLPVLTTELSGVTSVAAGSLHSLALRADGSVWAWGWNSLGQLGDGSTTDRHAPVRIGPFPFPRAPQVVIAAGAYHSVSLGNNGLAYAWGWNGFGQLGTADASSSSVPNEVATAPGVAVIAAGGGHTIAGWKSSPG